MTGFEPQTSSTKSDNCATTFWLIVRVIYVFSVLWVCVVSCCKCKSIGLTIIPLFAFLFIQNFIYCLYSLAISIIRNKKALDKSGLKLSSIYLPLSMGHLGLNLAGHFRGSWYFRLVSLLKMSMQ